MPASKSRKIAPLRKVSPLRIKNPDREFVYLENDRLGVKVPLRNRHGLLNGVFETHDGKLLEFRFSGSKYVAYIGNRWIGEVTPVLDHRDVHPEFDRQGIGTELFDLAEPAFARRLPNAKKSEQGRGSSRRRVYHRTVLTFTNKKDTAAFFGNRGYAGLTSFDAERLKKIKGQPFIKREEYIPDLSLTKQLQGTKFDNLNEWHRIKVLGRNGKPIWYTLRVLPMHALPFSP